MTTLYVAITAVLTLSLLGLLLRPGQTRPMTLWLLAALLPVLVAVTAALWQQDEVQATLKGFDPAPRQRLLIWRDQKGELDRSILTLSGLDAACLVRASGKGGTYQLGGGKIVVPPNAQRLGSWPSPEQAEALMLSGQLGCRRASSE
ncbi:hypothetical protein [Deinococcus sp.]|uniref:hypothetical protein n=1 Tax=Deinococcus sp. TaxID=47478 RepID=UPI003B5C4FF3